MTLLRKPGARFLIEATLIIVTAALTLTTDWHWWSILGFVLGAWVLCALFELAVSQMTVRSPAGVAAELAARRPARKPERRRARAEHAAAPSRDVEVVADADTSAPSDRGLTRSEPEQSEPEPEQSEAAAASLPPPHEPADAVWARAAKPEPEPAGVDGEQRPEPAGEPGADAESKVASDTEPAVPAGAESKPEPEAETDIQPQPRPEGPAPAGESLPEADPEPPAEPLLVAPDAPDLAALGSSAAAEPVASDSDSPPESAPPPAAARSWNIWNLEQLVRAGAPDHEERNFLLLYLREYANADGALPADFDGLVRESFGDLLLAETR